VLVAIALIEYGMDAISAVTFIRERRYASVVKVYFRYFASICCSLCSLNILF
jgi:hypothetical protein